MRNATIALLAAAAIGLAACGDDEEDAASAPTTTAAPFTTATTPPTPTTSTVATSDRAARLKISKDLSSKPEIPEPSGAPPTSLMKRDIVVGRGRTAQRGDMLSVQYVGALFDTGEQFDASWDTGRPFSFTLGQQEVIGGWDQGIRGMKVGGRRLLVIPPSLAYGSTGQGPIPPDATLVFVVDLLNVSAG